MSSGVLYDFCDNKVKFTFTFPTNTDWEDYDVVWITIYSSRDKTEALQVSGYPSDSGWDSDLFVPDTEVGICYVMIDVGNLEDIRGSLTWTIEGTLTTEDSAFADDKYDSGDKFEALTVEGL